MSYATNNTTYAVAQPTTVLAPTTQQTTTTSTYNNTASSLPMSNLEKRDNVYRYDDQEKLGLPTGTEPTSSAAAEQMREWQLFKQFQVMNNGFAGLNRSVREGDATFMSGDAGYGSMGSAPLFRVQQFPMTANPGPLGFASFSITLAIWNLLAAGAWVDISGPMGVSWGPFLFLGGLVMLLSAMWEFRTGNTFGSLTFGVYAGFFMSVAALQIQAFNFLGGYVATGSPTVFQNAIGVMFFVWTIFTFCMWIASHRTNMILFTFYAGLTAMFLLYTIAYLVPSPSVRQAGGIVGVCCAGLCLYLCMAGLLTPENSLFTLPMWSLQHMWVLSKQGAAAAKAKKNDHTLKNDKNAKDTKNVNTTHHTTTTTTTQHGARV